MHFSQALILSVIAAGVFAAPLDIEARHHTEAQIAAKKAAQAKGKNAARQAPDEFGPWDSTEDEFGSWVTPRDAEAEPHHTEAQIAAKKAKAAKGNTARDAEPEAHHTEAQIAAKKAKAAKANPARHAPDEFGPWDSTEDEFGSWVTPRDAVADPEAEAHHTEAQIAAKKAKAAKGNTARQAPDEFGPWDSTEDEFGSWVTPRGAEAEAEPHHTEAQIAAKKAKAAKGNAARDAEPEAEPHHTEAQIAAKKAKAAKGGNAARDAEPEAEAEAHHTEAQIAAKKAKAAKGGN